MDIKEIGWGSMDWIELNQTRDQWKTRVGTVMSLRVPLNVGKFLMAQRLAASREELRRRIQSVGRSVSRRIYHSRTSNTFCQ
jgi:hypothetical protein